MRRLAIFSLAMLLLGLGCASRTPVSKGGSEASHQVAVESWLLAYDQQEERYLSLYEELKEKRGKDPQLIEARELASVAEEFYLMAEYETALELLQQAILFLEERRKVEETYP